MECKDDKIIDMMMDAEGFNRDIVECKGSDRGLW